MQQGTVAKKTEKGFGFIKVDGAPEGSKDLFFHSEHLANIAFDDLQEGDKVTFDVGSSEKGPNALNVAKV
jgi:CspA family cold shock protein